MKKFLIHSFYYSETERYIKQQKQQHGFLNVGNSKLGMLTGHFIDNHFHYQTIKRSPLNPSLQLTEQVLVRR